MEENKTEVIEEENKQEDKKPSSNSNYMKLIMLVAAVIVVGFMMFNKMGSSGEDSCVVVPQSPWGQSQAQAWVDLDTKGQNEAAAGFDLEVPTEIEETYSTVTYRVFTKQINEVTYYDEDDNKVIRIDKAIYCGNDILDTDDDNYSSINKITVGDIEVKERGSNDLYKAISWVKGEYSYGITVYTDGISEEKVIEYVNEID